jgi:hypothetical protein
VNAISDCLKNGALLGVGIGLQFIGNSTKIEKFGIDGI